MYCTKVCVCVFKCNQQTAERLTSVDLKRCGQQKVQALVNWFNPIIRGTVYLCFIYLRPWLSRPDHARLCTRSLNTDPLQSPASASFHLFLCGHDAGSIHFIAKMGFSAVERHGWMDFHPQVWCWDSSGVKTFPCWIRLVFPWTTFCG